jgi:hypothetical protein
MHSFATLLTYTRDHSKTQSDYIHGVLYTPLSHHWRHIRKQGDTHTHTHMLAISWK